MLKRCLALSGAIGCLYALHLALETQAVRLLSGLHIEEVDRHLALGELRHYSLLFVLGLPAALLLHAALSGRGIERLGRWLSAAGYLPPALAASLAAFVISHFVTGGAWFTDDEQAYLFQMESYGKLRFTVPALQPEVYFHHPFVLVTRVVDGVEHWAGIYPFVQPGLMALSRLLGSPLVSQWLCAGLISWNTGKLAEHLSGSREHGVLAAWLLSTSPALVGLAATYHTAVPSCLFSLLAMRALLWTRPAPTFLRGALLGLCTGATFLTRGLEGTLIVLFCGVALLATPALKRALPAIAGYALVGLLVLGVHAAANYAVTGDWQRNGYAVWEASYGRILGFGTGMMWNRVHSLTFGISQTATTLVRMNTWAFGWPVSLALPLLVLLKPFRNPGATLLLSLSLLQLSAYVFLPFGSVHDFGSAYHIWHVPWLACAAVLLVGKAKPWVLRGEQFLVALTLVGLCGFWPLQIAKWGFQAEGVLAPVRAVTAAAKGAKVVVLWSMIRAPGRDSWVQRAPASVPGARIIWMLDYPGAAEIAKAALPGYKIFRLSYLGAEPVVWPVP